MDNYEKLEIKLDNMNETMRSMLDLNRQTLGEIKKQNDVLGSRLQTIERDIEKAAESRKDIYKRLDVIERRCAVRETALPVSTGHFETKTDFNKEAKTFVKSTVGESTINAAKYITAIVSGAVVMKILDIIARRLGG
ncbi:hypothetical protein AGMMS49957_10470 [Synergistales bacterium]|nr:hypothetical protein AGMMS49957_10470 [Synergistales bacterium]